ncbi:DUF2461 domain-containing protein [Cryobacterium frigoriphilum]|uniref:DUF2461 domain-containing protein n=1 Tax=Cryobacterium frigoriphilum TaxID=1259150 RepID=UPI0018E0BFF9|nr:DUF2461 domain-containing protein [Cryobacterium frigoriphilum]
MSDPITGPHLSEASFDFLEELEHRNNREWFLEHKSTYELELKDRMLLIADAISAGLAEFAPEHVRPPAKAVMRIYRDVRFARDKTPYKTHVAAFWPRQGLEKTGGAGYFVQIGVHGVMIAAGSYLPAAPQLFAIREYLLEHHTQMRRVLSAVERTGLAEPLDGHRLIRSPKGFDAEHPAVDLLRNRQWAVTANLPGDAALGVDFTALVIERFRAMTPLVNLLNVPLAEVTPLQREATAGRR